MNEPTAFEGPEFWYWREMTQSKASKRKSNMRKGTEVCGKTAIHAQSRNKNNKITNKKFHMDDKIPESSVSRWRGMGLDAFL